MRQIDKLKFKIIQILREYSDAIVNLFEDGITSKTLDESLEIDEEYANMILELLKEEKEKQYGRIVQILEKILGYCGIWHEDDIISVERKTGHGVSMTIKTFLKLLKEEMVENKKGRPK